MKASELAALLLQVPDAEVRLLLGECACPVAFVENGDDTTDGETVVVLTPHESSWKFYPELDLVPLEIVS